MEEIVSGTQFDFTFAPGVSQEQILGFELAGEVWSSYLRDDVTINLHVDISDELPENVIGGALSNFQGNFQYRDLKDSLAEDATSDNDLLASANLAIDKNNFFGAIVNGKELDKGKKTKLTSSNAKALNITDGNRSELDGYIVINDLTNVSGVDWYYDALRPENIQDNQLDFLSVASHEIGHVLGFVSGVDDGDWLTTLTRSEDKKGKIRDNAIQFATPLDLYRYSPESAQTGQIDFSIGEDSYFSLDGGQTNLAEFSTGEYRDFGGDGFQASHWRERGNEGIMQPLINTGVTKRITPLDLTAMDAIGWDIATPELDWQELHDTATANTANSTIVDRSDDLERLSQNNEQYNGRISRYSTTVRYFWQTGSWQLNTIGGVDSPESVNTSSLEETAISDDSIFSELDNTDSTDVQLDESGGQNVVEFTQSDDFNNENSNLVTGIGDRNFSNSDSLLNS